MNIALDYSGGHPTGNAVKSVGATKVVRYAGIGSSGKRLTKAEYQSLAAAGIRVDLVAEKLTTDADSGYNAGVANCRALEADRVAFGMPADTVMYAANDKPSYNAADVDYVRGFRDVVGSARAGVYGFGSYLAAVHADGYCQSYWQAGPAPSRTGTTAYVGLWQRQGGTVNQALDGPSSPTTVTVAGVACDINNILIEDDMGLTADEHQWLQEVHNSLWVSASTAYGDTVYDSNMNTKTQLAAITGSLSDEHAAVMVELAKIESAQAAGTTVELSAAQLAEIEAKFTAALPVGYDVSITPKSSAS